MPQLWSRHTLLLEGGALASSSSFLGARRAVVMLRGAAGPFWAGHYGAKHSAPCLRFVSPDGSWAA